jgi:DNA polymerase-1
MEPSGVRQPLVYVLGEAPSAADDRAGMHFSDVELIHDYVYEEWGVRWNYCVRTHPGDRAPNAVEMECCRPSVEEDIAKSKPAIIIGIGNTPLRWMLDMQNPRIDQWAGRYIPVEIKNHKCWFFPVQDHKKVLETLKWGHSAGKYGSEAEFSFAMTMQRAFELAGQLDDPQVHSIEQIKKGIECIHDIDRIVELLAEASQEHIAGFDYETNALRPYAKDAKVLTIAVSTRSGTFAFPYLHSQAIWTEPQLAQIDKAWRKFLRSSRCRKISHNLAFELEWSAVKWGEDLLWQQWEDSLGQAYILDERRGTVSLEFQCLQYFGFNIKKISNVDTLNLDNTPLDDVLVYNAIDAKYHRKLYLQQRDRLIEEGLEDVYRHQVDRISAIVHGQMAGVPVDQSVSRALEKKFTKELVRIEKEINESAEGKKFISQNGFAYRPASPFDVRKMFKIMGKRVDKTDEKAIAKTKHPIARNTIAWRKANKLLGTYVKPCRTGSELLYPDGKLHPIINAASTVTWRTSSEHPNIQNFPKRAGKGIEARSQIRVDEDHWIVAFDYAGIQARNVAMESKDKALVKAFWNRYDVHTTWMERLIKLCPTWYSKKKGDVKEHRSEAKNAFVFPSLFGARPASIARTLNVDEAIAQRLQDEFWGEFPDIHRWHKECHEFYREHGYVTGLSGFRRRAPIDPNQLINAPIQGDESRIVMDAMIRLSKLGIPTNMEIHDDLTFIWHKKDVDKNMEIVVTEMTKVVFDWINVPIAVEAGIGREWALIKPIGEFASDTWKGSFDKTVLHKIDPNKGSWSDGTGWSAVAKDKK